MERAAGRVAVLNEAPRVEANEEEVLGHGGGAHGSIAGGVCARGISGGIDGGIDGIAPYGTQP
jgi:hypothetical protein